VTAFKKAKKPYNAKPVAYSKDRAIVASATRLNLSKQGESEKLRKRAAANQPWQDESWTYYDSIGEIKFGYGLLASTASRVRLYVGVVVDPDAPPVAITEAVAQEGDDSESTADDAADARTDRGIDDELAKQADEIFRKALARSSVSSMMRNAVLNISVPGECYLVRANDRWSIRSTSEIRVSTDGRYQVQRSIGDGQSMQFLPPDEDGTVVGRVWREHPRYSMDPDSALLGLRADCEELLLLSRMVRAVTRSRLNAGLLYVPDEISVVSRNPGDTTEEDEEQGDPFETELLYSITEPINTEDAAASVVPMLARGPAELADKIKHILFERKSDEFLVARADRVLERILQGLDIPKDVVTGLANVKYSNAVQIDENMYKAHVEPLCVMIADAFTDIVLHPLLKEAGIDPSDYERIVVWYDPSEVVVRPNRADDADKGYDKGLLSGSAWRDAHGFGDTDAPDEDEMAFRLAWEKAVVPEELATVLFNKLLPTITQAARAASGDNVPPEMQQMLDGEIPQSPTPDEVAAPPGAPAPPADEATLEEPVADEAPPQEEAP
jgi:hypothetical protein